MLVAKLPWSQFLRYAAAGAVTFTIEYSSLIFLVEYFGEEHLLYANAFAFIAASICNYSMSRYWVFGRGKHLAHVEMMAYFGSTAVGLVINQIVLWYLVEGFVIDYRLAKLVAIGAVIVWNYWIRRVWVFKK